MRKLVWGSSFRRAFKRTVRRQPRLRQAIEEALRLLEAQVAVGHGVDIADVGGHHDVLRHVVFQGAQGKARVHPLAVLVAREGAEAEGEAGGQGRAPDAASYISAGIGFCFMTQLGRYAKIAKKDLSDYRVLQDTHFSLGGATANTGEAGSADPVETHVDLVSEEDDAFAQTALAMSEQTCFLHALCRTDIKTRIRLTA